MSRTSLQRRELKLQLRRKTLAAAPPRLPSTRPIRTSASDQVMQDVTPCLLRASWFVYQRWL